MTSAKQNELLSLAISRGDDDYVLKVMYKKVLPKIKKYVMKNNGSEADALDVFQEGVVRFYQQIQRKGVDFENEVIGYVYTICRNYWVTSQRRKGLETYSLEDRPDLDTTDYVTAEGVIMTKEQESLVAQLLNQIGDACKGILEDMFFLGKSQKEIAVSRGFTTEDALKMKAYRCRKKLEDLIMKNNGLHKLLRA